MTRRREENPAAPRRRGSGPSEQLRRICGGVSPAASESSLDGRTEALVRLGALVAMGAGRASYERDVGRALAAGATERDVVDTLIAVAPTVGLAHLVAATTSVSLGLGYDIDAVLEGTDDPPWEGTER